MIKLFENNKQFCFFIIICDDGGLCFNNNYGAMFQPQNDGKFKKHISRKTKIEICGIAKELIKIFYHQFKCIYFELNIVCIFSYLLKKNMKSLTLFHHTPCLFIRTVYDELHCQKISRFL